MVQVFRTNVEGVLKKKFIELANLPAYNKRGWFEEVKPIEPIHIPEPVVEEQEPVVEMPVYKKMKFKNKY